MTETIVKYKEEEILAIFKEQHRLCSPCDPEADPWAEITAEMSIREWRCANDLIEWKRLSEFINQEFRIEVPKEEWFKVLEPSRLRKLKGVCRLIAKYAVKDIYEPKALFGRPCLKAGVFLTMKKNLKDKGVNVSELKPSSLLGEYIDNYPSQLIEEITMTGTKPISEIGRRRKKKGFWNAINIFDPDRYETITGDVITFRDLTERIIEEKTGHNNRYM